MKYKRMVAYVIDVIIVYLIANMIYMIAFKEDYEKYVKKSEDYLEVVKENANNAKINTDELNKKSYEVLKDGESNQIINLSVEIIYFIFLQYFLKGQTPGKKLLKIKIKSTEGKDLNATFFVLREVILFNVLTRLIDLVFLISANMNTYLIVNNITSKINMIVTLAIIGTVILRKDEKGIHDIICKTEVVKVNKEERK